VSVLAAELARPTDVPVVLAVASAAGTTSRLVEQLDGDGFHPLIARSPAHARVLAGSHRPAIVVLGDLDEPHAALALLAEIRAAEHAGSSWDPGVPVIVASRHADEIDVLRAFERGADDFVAEPLRYLELRARLRAQLRRRDARGRRWLQAGTLEIDRAGRTARLAGRRLALSRLEFELLTHLATDPERVFARDELLREVWGFRAPGATRTLDSHASRLRLKLGGDGPRWIANVRGVGYRLRD
jgi:DNA-binding response OmpR family regulator